MGKIYQFINFLGRATTTSNSYNRVYVDNTNRLSSHVDGKFDPDTQLRIAFNSISRNMLVRLPEYFVYGKSIDGKSSFVGRGYFERVD